MTGTLLITLLVLAADAPCAPCATGAQCIEGACRFVCRTDDGCPRGLVCSESGACEARLRRLPGHPPTLRRGDATHPERFKYGSMVPPGFHLVSEIDWAAAAGGLATFAVAYLPFVVIGAANGNPVNLAPIIGPTLAYRASGELSAFVNVVIALGVGLDALVQLAGVTKFVVALAVPRKWLEREAGAPQVSFAPAAPGADLGASVLGSF